MTRDQQITRLVALGVTRSEIADRSHAFLDALLGLIRAELVNRYAAALVVAIVHPRSTNAPAHMLGANLFTSQSSQGECS